MGVKTHPQVNPCICAKHPPSPIGPGARGEGSPNTNHVILSEAEGSKIHTTYHAQPTATNIKTEVPPSPYGRGAGGEGQPPDTTPFPPWLTHPYHQKRITKHPPSPYETGGGGEGSPLPGKLENGGPPKP